MGPPATYHCEAALTPAGHGSTLGSLGKLNLLSLLLGSDVQIYISYP